MKKAFSVLFLLSSLAWGQDIQSHLICPGTYRYPGTQAQLIQRTFSVLGISEQVLPTDVMYWGAQLNNASNPDPLGSFFRTLLQQSQLDNAHWALVLYQAMLYFDPDPASYQNTLAALNWATGQGQLVTMKNTLISSVLGSNQWAVYAFGYLRRFTGMDVEIP